jgi:hypothetical protein
LSISAELYLPFQSEKNSSSESSSEDDDDDDVDEDDDDFLGEIWTRLDLMQRYH